MHAASQRDAQILGTSRNLVIFFFYFISFGFSILYYSLAGIIATLVATYAQVCIGYYGDSVKSSLGRRKPLVLAGTFLLVAGVCGICFPPVSFDDQSVLFGWLTLCSTFTYVGAMTLSTPLSSWIIESSADDADFVRINTLPRNIGMLIGVLAGAALTELGYVSAGTFAIFTSIVTLLSLYFLVKYVPNPVYMNVPKQPDLIPSLRTCLRTKEFKTIFLNEILLQVTPTVAQDSTIYMILLGFHVFTMYSQLAVVTILFVVVGTVFGYLLVIPLNWIVRSYDKLTVYKIITCVVVVCCILSFFSTLTTSLGGLYGFIIFQLLVYIMQIPIATIDTFFVKDLVLYDTLISGLNRENMYQTAISVPVTLIKLIIGTFPVSIFYASGFFSRTEASTDDQIVSKFLWNETVIWEFRVFGSLFPAALAIASYFVIRDHSLTSKVAAQIEEAVKKKELERTQVGFGDNTEGEKGDDEGNHGEADRYFGDDKSTDRLIIPLTGADTSVAAAAAMAPSKSEFPSDGESVIGNADDFFMNHFSALEVKRMSQPQGVEESLSQITSLVISGIVLGLATTAVLVAGFVVQFLHKLEQFSEMLIALILIVSFYVLYELLRLRAIRQLRRCEPATFSAMVQSAHSANKSYGKNLKILLNRHGILEEDAYSGSSDGPDPRGGPGGQARIGTTGIVGGTIATAATSKDGAGEAAGGLQVQQSAVGRISGAVNAAVGSNQQKSLLSETDLLKDEGEGATALSGYKRIFFCLSLLLVFGVLNCTVFVSTPVQPSNHTPSAAPTLEPKLGPRGRSLLPAALRPTAVAADGMLGPQRGHILLPIGPTAVAAIATRVEATFSEHGLSEPPGGPTNSVVDSAQAALSAASKAGTSADQSVGSVATTEGGRSADVANAGVVMVLSRATGLRAGLASSMLISPRVPVLLIVALRFMRGDLKFALGR